MLSKNTIISEYASYIQKIFSFWVSFLWICVSIHKWPLDLTFAKRGFCNRRKNFDY